jgi:hypothetical protein
MPVLANRPVIRNAAKAAVQAVVETVQERRRGNAPVVTPAAQEAAVAATAERIAASPTLVNAMNAEPWWQSRVKVGLIIMFVGWIAGRFGWDLNINEADKELITNMVMVFGGGIAGVGRWVQNLPPINWRRPWTLLGIGR